MLVSKVFQSKLRKNKQTFGSLKSECCSKRNPVPIPLINIAALLYFIMGQHRPLFVYFRSFQTQILQKKSCRGQWDSISDHLNRRRARWPLHHHHGHAALLYAVLVLNPQIGWKFWCSQSEYLKAYSVLSRPLLDVFLLPLTPYIGQ